MKKSEVINGAYEICLEELQGDPKKLFFRGVKLGMVTENGFQRGEWGHGLVSELLKISVLQEIDMALTGSERVAKAREKKKAEGFKRCEYVLTPKQKKAVDEFVKTVRGEHGS